MLNYRKTIAEIDLQALSHNYQQVKNLVGKSKIMVVIKADAYGHGLLALSDSLTQADAYAVACVDEGIELRNHGITKLIIILEGYSSSDELDALIENNLSPVINNLSQLDLLINKKLINKVDIWLKFDTGMHRLGFQAKQVNALFERFKNLSPKICIYGLMSHFANADLTEFKRLAGVGENTSLNTAENMGKDTNSQQELEFKLICDSFVEVIKTNSDHAIKKDINYSMANSAAIINLPNSHKDWVRPGIMLYGVDPVVDSVAKNNCVPDLRPELRPVMTLKSQIIAINNLSEGDCIGYGSDWCCPENMSVAVVAIGYGDGYPRHAISGTPVLVNGIKTQLIGRVSMDMITIDLRPLFLVNSALNIGDTVILWGKGLAVEKVASYSSTIAYELLCGISNRVKLKYIN
jgi:alanine racemase